MSKSFAFWLRLCLALVDKENMSAISQIIEKLTKYPELSYEKEGNSISVTPDNGFLVWLTETESNLTVGFSGWHEEFSDIEEALNCFAFGLSSKCRLKIYRRGDTEYKWIVHVQHENEWSDDSETGLFFFPFWRKKEIICLQNAIIRN